MSGLLKWFSVLLFIATPALFTAAILLSDWRYALVALVTAFFSMLAGGFSDALARTEHRSDQLGLF